MIYPTQHAPDFEAEAYQNGKKVTIRLKDFQNQWVLLFFYASDFTFV
ncbi:MAG: redoxin domain-containing protein [Desulfosporosinus sp.]|nr:redoxin domain-containing protein [Desulfosporosinus sp.]